MMVGKKIGQKTSICPKMEVGIRLGGQRGAEYGGRVTET